MRVRLFPYNRGSRSARMLAEQTGWLRLRTDGTSRFRPRDGDTVVNWGSSRCPDYPCRVLNPRQSIINAADKLTSFRLLKEAGVAIPDFWESYENAPRDTKLVGRSTLTGHSGDGISIGRKGDEVLVSDAPLYTRYIPKEHEYRVHVVGDRAIFTQRKARRLEHTDPNWEVRNLANGFVFVAAECNEATERQAVAAVQALSLDFGAVDIIFPRREPLQPLVLEVNTACGLEERTAQKYAEALDNYINPVLELAA